MKYQGRKISEWTSVKKAAFRKNVSVINEYLVYISVLSLCIGIICYYVLRYILHGKLFIALLCTFIVLLFCAFLRFLNSPNNSTRSNSVKMSNSVGWRVNSSHWERGVLMRRLNAIREDLQ